MRKYGEQNCENSDLKKSQPFKKKWNKITKNFAYYKMAPFEVPSRYIVSFCHGFQMKKWKWLNFICIWGFQCWIHWGLIQSKFKLKIIEIDDWIFPEQLSKDINGQDFQRRIDPCTFQWNSKKKNDFTARGIEPTQEERWVEPVMWGGFQLQSQINGHRECRNHFRRE